MSEHRPEEGTGHVHVPQYSFAPIVVATGIFIGLMFFVFGPAPGIVGLILFVIGLVMWIREDVRYFDGGHDAGH